MFTLRQSTIVLACTLAAGCRTSESKLAAQLGTRNLSDSAVAKDPLPMLGVEFATREPSGWGAEFGFQAAEDSDLATVLTKRLTVGELYVGPRYTWSLAGGGIQPYMSAGGSLLFSEIEGLGVGPGLREDSLDPGLYAGAGVDWILGKSFVLGLGARYVWTNATFDGGTLDGDALVPFVRIGARF